jgi:disulfide bond formation protein DsbB
LGKNPQHGRGAPRLTYRLAGGRVSLEDAAERSTNGAPVTHAFIVVLAVLGVIGQVIAALLFIVGVLWLFGVRGPLEFVRSGVWGYELWLAFIVAAIATAGSLFFSEIAGFVPCELCWYQRICMYPLSILTLLAALANDYRVARYLLPLPVVGAGISVYHLLVENGVVAQASGCLVSAPGGCATKWINEFGYMTIPTLALTGFALCFAFLALAATEHGGATVEGHG